MEVEVSLGIVEERAKCKELEKVIIDTDAERYFQIGV